MLNPLMDRHSTWLALPFIAGAAYLQSKGTTALARSALDRGVPQSTESVPARDGERARPRRSAEPILDRNPFDTSARLVPLSHRDRDAGSADVLAAPDCGGFTTVIITESADANWSVAALRGPSDPRSTSHRVGDRVSGALVTYIGFNPRRDSPSVWMIAGGTLCQVSLFDGRPTLERVEPQTATVFRVERAVLDRALANAADWTARLRVVPETSDGRVVGIRLFGIRPGSTLASLGLLNGDRLESVNGFDVSAPEEALAAYAHLRTASRLRVALHRNGKPLALEYEIE